MSWRRKLLPPDGALAILRRLAGHGLAYRWTVLAALASFIASGATVLALGQGVRELIDHGVHRDLGELNTAALKLLLLVLVYGAAALGRTYLSARLGERVTTDLRKALFRNLLAHGPGFFELRGTARLWSQVGVDGEQLQSMVTALLTAVRNALIVAGGLVAMLATSASLTLLVLVMAPVITLVLVRGWTCIRALSDAALGAVALANTRALEAVDGVRIVKAFGQEATVADGFDAMSEQAFARADRRNLALGLISGASIWMVFGAAVLLAWVSGAQVTRDQASEGLTTAFLFYAVVVANAGAGLADAWGQLHKGLGAAERIFGLTDEVPDIGAPAAPLALPARLRGDIEMREVGFSYPARPNAMVLDRFSWTATGGATVALVGPSGAGKSTLFHLLMRLYDPQAGVVCIDGLDLRRLDPKVLRTQIALVPQEPVLFEGSILDNIRFGRPEASEAQALDAARAAYVTEFAERLPQGQCSQVGARGAQLSGGQRQRIAIARAILRDPAILLLDEATNALDAQSEHLVQQALERLAKGRTTLVIAHRLATVQSAATIVVMAEGRIRAQGRHDQLLHEDADYARWVELQSVRERAE